MIEAVILDVDGTVIDSNDAHARAWEIALKEAGHDVPYDRVRALIGAGAYHILPRLAQVDADSAAGEAISAHRREVFREKFLGGLVAFPGTRDLLEEFRNRGIKLVVASSGSADDVSALLRQAEIDDLVQAEATADDAERSKPAPDIVFAALKKLGLESRAVVMLGDTPYDVEAAQRAGIDIIAFTCGGWDVAALKGAVEIFSDPLDLLYNFEKSLFGSRVLPLETRREQFGRIAGARSPR